MIGQYFNLILNVCCAKYDFAAKHQSRQCTVLCKHSNTSAQLPTAMQQDSIQPRLIALLFPTSLRSPCNNFVILRNNVTQSRHHIPSSHYGAISVEFDDFDARDFPQNALQEIRTKPLVEPFTFPVSTKNRIARIAFHKHFQDPHICTITQAQRIIHNPSSRRVGPSRSQAQIQRSHRCTVVSRQTC